MNDPRDDYIRKVVEGKSFVDVGGLWGTVGEKISVAHGCGASALTMIDVTPPGAELWRLFDERRRDLQVPEVYCLSGDLLALVEKSGCPQFDVVHCSGVLYHIPNPLQFLVALHKITRCHLVLGSVITANRVESALGVLEVPHAAALFIPAHDGRERAILKSYWERFVGNTAGGVTHEVSSWRLDDFSPWWWLPTVEALIAMCRAAGFSYQEGSYFWDNNLYALLLSVEVTVLC